MASRVQHEKEILILGGGFAGIYCAKQLAKRLGREYADKIGLVSNENYMAFQPMLPEVAGASLAPRHVINTIRHLCKGVDVYKGEVASVDPEAKEVIINAGSFSHDVHIRYQHLVLALGAQIDLSRVPGMGEHAMLMQNVGDAMKLRATLISRFEEANLIPDKAMRRQLLTFTVVGGGYSGVETAGQILDLLHSIHRFYHHVDGDDFRVILIHSRDHLLPTLSEKLGRYAEDKLRERGMEIWLKQRVKAVTAKRVYLQSGNIIDTSTIICTIGNAPHHVVNTLCRTHNIAHEKGRIVTDELLRVKGRKDLWAAGDCALVPMASGGYCPATAQFSMRQGRVMGDNLASSIQGGKQAPFTFTGLGELATIGHRNAVASVMGLQFSGFLAWWMWRTVYLMKLPGIERKLRIMIEWTLDLFFPRDINLLNPRYTTDLSHDYLEPGDYLFHAGEPAFSLYVVESGSVEILDGEKVIKVAEVGDYFGERALLDDGVWHFDCRAREETTLVSLPSSTFRPLVSSSAELKQLFSNSARAYLSEEEVDGLRGRLSEKVKKARVSELMTKEVRKLTLNSRVSDALDLFKEHHHTSCPIVDKTNRIQGMLERSGLYDYLKQSDADPKATVGALDWSLWPTVQQDEVVGDVIERFLRENRNKLLVVDKDDKLVGVLAIVDLVTA